LPHHPALLFLAIALACKHSALVEDINAAV